MIRKFAKQLIARFARYLIKTKLLPDCIILNMDGGICSQMHFYIAGKTIESRGQKVIFNLDWYDKVGKDMDGRFCRNFDLLKAFPDLEFSATANRLLIKLYKISFCRHNEYFEDNRKPQWPALKSPAFILGYFKETDEMFGKIFTDTFCPCAELPDRDNRDIYGKIETYEAERGTCGIHVRRGDLARSLDAYGTPVTADYFEKSCREVTKETPGVKFYMFSDEPEWCRQNLMPLLRIYDIEICDINGSDKGWCDLILMSRCRHQISSQGSMGRYAALLRPADRRNGLVTLPDNPVLAEWKDRFEHCITIK